MVYLKHPEHPSLGLVMWFLRYSCIWTPDRSKTRTYIYYSFILIITILGINQFLYAVFSLQPDYVLNLLTYSIYHIGVYKLFHYELNRNKWEKLIKYVSDIEKQVRDDPVYKDFLCKYVKKIRMMCTFYMLACISSVITVLIKWLLYIHETDLSSENYTPLVFYFWWPFEGGKFVRYFDIVAQNFYGQITSVWVIVIDSLILTLMAVFTGQLGLIKVAFSHSLDDEDEEVQRKSLMKYHKHYLSLLKYQSFFNSLIDPVMFVYLLTSSVNLSLTIIRMNAYSRAEAITAFQFLSGLLTQLLLFYWYSNEVTEQSKLTSYGVFESSWVNKSLMIQRQVALLSVATTKRITFTAGPFNEMSLDTFVAILRGSYSLYTLMNQTK